MVFSAPRMEQRQTVSYSTFQKWLYNRTRQGQSNNHLARMWQNCYRDGHSVEVWHLHSISVSNQENTYLQLQVGGWSRIQGESTVRVQPLPLVSDLWNKQCCGLSGHRQFGFWKSRHRMVYYWIQIGYGTTPLVTTLLYTWMCNYNALIEVSCSILF